MPTEGRPPGRVAPVTGGSRGIGPAIAKTLAEEGARVAVAPGSIRHPGGSWDRRMRENPEAMRAFVEANIPSGRFGTPEEVTNVVVFLASPKASWTVGTTVVVDGGQSKMF